MPLIRALADALLRARPAVIAALPAALFDEKDLPDFDSLIQSFAHVVDREGCGGNRDQRFHLHARLRGGGYVRAYFHAIFAQPRGPINLRQRQWMTKRYPLGGAF